LKKNVPVDVAKRAIELFDIEKGYKGQPPELMDELERMLGMEGVEWPTAGYRLMMISQKLVRELKKILTSYGYVFPFVSMLLKLANIPCRYRLFVNYCQRKETPDENLSRARARNPPYLNGSKCRTWFLLRDT
jgi:hypothetical protein